jgi:hypothetical protein
MRRMRSGNALDQSIGLVVVHQEADRAELHAIDRQATLAMTMHGLQHESIPAERTEHFGVVGFVAAMHGLHRGQRGLRIGCATCEKSDAWRRGHWLLRGSDISIAMPKTFRSSRHPGESVNDDEGPYTNGTISR